MLSCLPALGQIRTKSLAKFLQSVEPVNWRAPIKIGRPSHPARGNRYRLERLLIVLRTSVEHKVLRIVMGEQLSSPDSVIRSNNLDTCRGTRVRLSHKLRGEEGEAAWHKAVTAPEALVALDLFCGAGGLSYGFQEAGFVSALGIDSDADACETHAANLLSRTLCQDIRTIKHPQALVEELGIPRVDVVIGGPPCQGFSCLRW